MVSIKILYYYNTDYYNIILWDHRRIYGPSSTEMTLCVFVCLYCGRLPQRYYPTRHTVSSKLLAHQAQIDVRAYMLDVAGFIVLT
jgi:hypothetical protein